MYRDLFHNFEPPLQNLRKILLNGNPPLYGPDSNHLYEYEHVQKLCSHQSVNVHILGILRSDVCTNDCPCLLQSLHDDCDQRLLQSHDRNS